MTARPHHIARSLTSIACDMATTKQRLSCHYARMRDPTDDEDRDWRMLEDRRDALVAEFRAAFRAATGMDWNFAEEVMS